ncbi:MAG: 4Fe-4S binding protein [Desulfoplanes sp.]|nr:4Fe-4S binding protein [Desulfoplanes sp.]
MKDTVKKWLEEKQVDMFLGYKMVHGHALPYCFQADRLDEVDDLVVSRERYSLEKMATHIAAVYPEMKIGMLARDCNQRALKVLDIWDQLKKDSVTTFNVNCCPSPLKNHGDCSYLEPSPVGPVKVELGIDNNMSVEHAEHLDQKERFAHWMYEFSKCIKCYGCRNICPVCFCKDCSLEHPELIRSGGALPTEVPLFHLVRAAHMAGRCIDCGLCEDACPMDIPLRLLYRKVGSSVSDLFGYRPGIDEGKSPFNLIGDAPTTEPRPI